MDIFRDDISLIINESHLQATEGSLRRTESIRKPRSANKRSALVIIITIKDKYDGYVTFINIYIIDMASTSDSGKGIARIMDSFQYI